MSSIDIIVPVYNEEKCLAENIEKLRQFLIQSMSSYSCRIVIVDNGSIDGTLAEARDISTMHPEVTLMHLDVKGRGYALRQAWQKSSADIVSYMDVDLSTELSDFPRLVSAIAQDGYDIAIGSRHLPNSRVKRSFKRTLLSGSYNLLRRAMFRTTFRDTQCGFKALRREVAIKLIPLVKDQAWLFDTELLILAEKQGYRIKEIPVIWTEDMTSTVNILPTVAEAIKCLVRLRKSRYED
jgi:glycosyltransferase involved in cell wall biosynthesis